jgi:hypothetical protein
MLGNPAGDAHSEMPNSLNKTARFCGYRSIIVCSIYSFFLSCASKNPFVCPHDWSKTDVWYTNSSVYDIK